MKAFTEDTFFNGRIQVKQNLSGYRFSIDAVLLACHAKSYSGGKVLDLGTGCGIIPLMLAYCNPKVRIYGIEVQEKLADIALLNVKENHMENQIVILYKDIKEITQDMISGPADLVVSNPPYRKAESGRLNPNQQRAVARHEIKITLYDVVKTARRILRTSGRFIVIYPSERIADLLTHMRSASIEPKFLRIIYSGLYTESKLILVEGVKGGRPGAKIGPPLIIYNKNGSYTDEVKEMCGLSTVNTFKT